MIAGFWLHVTEYAIKSALNNEKNLHAHNTGALEVENSRICSFSSPEILMTKFLCVHSPILPFSLLVFSLSVSAWKQNGLCGSRCHVLTQPYGEAVKRRFLLMCPLFTKKRFFFCSEAP